MTDYRIGDASDAPHKRKNKRKICENLYRNEIYESQTISTTTVSLSSLSRQNIHETSNIKRHKNNFKPLPTFFPLSRKKFPKYHIKPYNILQYHTLKNPLKKKKKLKTPITKKKQFQTFIRTCCIPKERYVKIRRLKTNEIRL